MEPHWLVPLRKQIAWVKQKMLMMEQPSITHFEAFFERFCSNDKILSANNLFDVRERQQKRHTRWHKKWSLHNGDKRTNTPIWRFLVPQKMFLPRERSGEVRTKTFNRFVVIDSAHLFGYNCRQIMRSSALSATDCWHTITVVEKNVQRSELLMKLKPRTVSLQSGSCGALNFLLFISLVVWKSNR